MNECEIFMASLEKSSLHERQAFLDEACGGNAELRRRIESLLQSHGQAGSLLEHPAMGEAATVAPGQSKVSTDGAAHLDGDRLTPADEIPLDFLAPSALPQALGRIGPYDVTGVVGRGGMGVVLKAQDAKLSRVVAIKVLAPELACNPTAKKRFLREARAAASVVHQHVVTIHAVDEDRLPYLVMEYIDGQSLQEKIDREGHLELKEILRIGQQVAAGLAAAHAHGLMHRDVKPANILLENGVERVRITDFGLARAVDDVGMTRTGEVAGTPQYMSPEQAQGLAMDARSDLFSLGCVLYAMCTGRPPFRAETTLATVRRVCEDTPRPIREVNPEVPPWLVEIIDRLLAKQPAQRFQTAQEVANLLGQHLAEVQHPSVALLPLPLASGGRKPIDRVASPGGDHRYAAVPGLPLAGRRWAITAAALAAVLAGSLGLSEATGVTHLASTVIRIATGEGTLIVEVNDPEVQVTVEGDGGLSITGAGPREVRVRPGSYRVKAAKDGQPIALEKELVTIARGGKEVVKVTLEGHRLAGGTVPQVAQPQPFVILGGQGIELRKFGNLADAVLAASDGDAIEIRGNGPFVTDPITIRNALRIRAAEGFRPVLTLSPGGAETNRPLLQTHAALVLEGLELQRIDGVPKGTILVSAGQHSVHIGNCRFLLDVPEYGHCIRTHSQKCILRNCEFSLRMGFGFGWISSPQGEFTIENCVNPYGGINHQGLLTQPASVRLRHNTFVGLDALLVTNSGSVSNENDAEATFNFEASDNIFDCSLVFLTVTGIEPTQAKTALGQLLAWHDQRNLYAVTGDLVWATKQGYANPVKVMKPGEGLAEWKRFWNSPDLEVLAGIARYHGGDIRSKSQSPEQLTPADFRLRPDSAGYRAGKDGKDLGADVDLVGPGAAYERWKKTPEYQEWLKETGQVK